MILGIRRPQKEQGRGSDSQDRMDQQDGLKIAKPG